MTDLQADDVASLVDLVSRITVTHGIDSKYIAKLLRLNVIDAAELMTSRPPRTPLGGEDRTRLSLFATILIRLEWRLHHHSATIRRAIETPIGVLGGVAPGDMLGGSLDDLLAVRRAIDTIEAPQVKWWRVGH